MDRIMDNRFIRDKNFVQEYIQKRIKRENERINYVDLVKKIAEK